MYLFYYRGLSYAGVCDYKSALKDFEKAESLGMEDVQKVIEECHRFLD